MKTRQINFRNDNPDVDDVLKKLEKMGFNQTVSLKIGALKAYEFAKNNPSEAAMLALTV